MKRSLMRLANPGAGGVGGALGGAPFPGGAAGKAGVDGDSAGVDGDSAGAAVSGGGPGPAAAPGDGAEGVSASAFEAWADRIGLTLRGPRAAVRAVLVEGMSINGAARVLGMAPSTVSRHVGRYEFPKCPCCGQVVPLGDGREDAAAAPG